ncbi:hypothetical protein C8F04DRAFT_1255169 [Mycena alexandri]|uniref:Uncharacterized protein n=1 Tax=Mycena alexandri TaxID=1745969 RepID=A0AAD6XBB4_9AGAR|nr:hypothetical protein C8F04DRAFT_1255169 [Mycena alexandri]
MKRKVTNAQRAASLRYRERNKTELQRKARERMARRRAELKKSDEAWASYRAKAQEDAARYRARHAEDLALNQCSYRSRKSIAKIGFKAWHEGYLKRHPIVPREEEEDLPEWPSIRIPSTAPCQGIQIPNATRMTTPATSRRGRPTLRPTRTCSTFLDYEDPTTAPDYVPKPGEQPFFQRGKRRWA